VWRRTLPGYYAKIGEASPPEDLDKPATYLDTTVESGSTYYYKIRAVSPAYADLLLPGGSSCPTCGDCIRPGNFSAEVSVVVTCNPRAPELKTVTYDQTNKKVTLTWTDPYQGTPAEGKAKFEVWRSTSPDSGYSKIAEVVSGYHLRRSEPIHQWFNPRNDLHPVLSGEDVFRLRLRSFLQHEIRKGHGAFALNFAEAMALAPRIGSRRGGFSLRKWTDVRGGKDRVASFPALGTGNFR
jgi:hypothetical protein